MLFFYDNILIILFSGVCLLSFSSYLNKREKAPAYTAVLFFCLFLNQLITSMAEFLPEFAILYNAAYQTMPIFSTVITISVSICLLKLSYNWNPVKQVKKYEYIILIGLSLVLLLVPTLKNSLFHLFLYSSILPVYLLYRGVCFCYLVHQERLKALHGFNPGLISVFSCISILAPLSGLMECFMKTFWFYLDRGIYSYRIFSFDFLFAMISVLYLFAFFQKETAPHQGEADIQSFQSQIPESASGIVPDTEMCFFYSFCKTYGLTLREQTILTELLSHTDYQQISEKLIISSFTVKSHVHNIFKKTGVKSRQELCAFYERFKHSSSG